MKIFKYGAVGILLIIVILNKLYWQEMPVEKIASINCYQLQDGCYFSDDNVKFKISSDKKVQAMKQFTLSVEQIKGINLTPIKVSYNMKEMDMGVNEYAFVNTGKKQWASDGLIPLCMSGIDIWVASIYFENATKEQFVLNVDFEVTR